MLLPLRYTRLKKSSVVARDAEVWKIGTKSVPPHPASPMPMRIFILSISSALIFAWQSYIWYACESHLAILPPSSDLGMQDLVAYRGDA